MLISRRRFIGRLGALIGAATAPQLFIPRLPDRHIWVPAPGVSGIPINRLSTEEIEHLFRPNPLFNDADAWLMHGLEMRMAGRFDRVPADSPVPTVYDWVYEQSS